VLSAIAGLLRLASVLICLIVVASFAVFVVDQAKGASTHQQETVNSGAPAANAPTGASGQAKTSPSKESGLHEAIDEASNELTSPFSGITSGSSSQWVIRGVNLVIALIVYGFGLGYLARALRVRA
jgi:tetrahydromethanopterin S-methyltransferase subunit D